MSAPDVIEKKIAENARCAREREELRNPPPVVESPPEPTIEGDEASKEEDIFDTAGLDEDDEDSEDAETE